MVSIGRDAGSISWAASAAILEPNAGPGDSPIAARPGRVEPMTGSVSYVPGQACRQLVGSIKLAPPQVQPEGALTVLGVQPAGSYEIDTSTVSSSEA